MDTPQEVEVWYILPAVRRQIAIALKLEGLKQKEIATALNITEPAVSQYIKQKRGEEISFPDKIKAEIILSAKEIAKDHRIARKETQRILKLITKEKFLCNVCHTHTNSEKNCKICY